MAEPYRRRQFPLDCPLIVCLCGSTRFIDEFHRQGAIETLAGRIVLSVGVFVHGPPDHAGEALGEDVKRGLDDLHKRKIDLADEVLILNVGGYMGESTLSELAWARVNGKRVRFLERPRAPLPGETWEREAVPDV